MQVVGKAGDLQFAGNTGVGNVREIDDVERIGLLEGYDVKSGAEEARAE